MPVQKQNIDDANTPEKVGTQYSVRNAHPEFGVNPNIKNEYGHTEYPKWVPHPTKKSVDRTTTYLGKDQSVVNVVQNDFPEMALVNNEKEEKALYASVKSVDKTDDKEDEKEDIAEDEKTNKKKNEWGKK